MSCVKSKSATGKAQARQKFGEAFLMVGFVWLVQKKRLPTAHVSNVAGQNSNKPIRDIVPCVSDYANLKISALAKTSIKSCRRH
eukprot:3708230-Karenia_brevis.AAC.1